MYGQGFCSTEVNMIEAVYMVTRIQMSRLVQSLLLGFITYLLQNITNEGVIFCDVKNRTQNEK